MDPASLIAINVVLLYSLLGPLVLFAVFVVFDWIGTDKDSPGRGRTDDKKDPALWSGREVNDFLDQA